LSFKRHHLVSGVNHYISEHFLLISDFCHKTRASFYWSLALVLSLAILLGSVFELKIIGSEEGTYDSIIKYRWASPLPSKEIVILDIDEKSLAQLAPTLGRWPWKREVLGEALSSLESSGVKSTILNILITDPDKGNQQSDAVLDAVASESKVTVYPVVRLPKKNDDKSSFYVSKLSGVKISGPDKTIALIMPGLPGMRKNIGFSNINNDEDGIIRTYSLSHIEDNWTMPTIVDRAISLSGAKSKINTDEVFFINWRNKAGSYKRIPFVDYYKSLNSSDEKFDLNLIKNKYVVLGTSAAGIANLKPTAANAITDDNEILATALDDALNKTNLKPIPEIVLSLLAILFILFLAYMFSIGSASEELDLIFIAIEIGSVVLMFFTMSYSTYFIDMSTLATYGLIFFTASKVHQNLAERVIKGAPEHLKQLAEKKPKILGVLSFSEDKKIFRALKKSFNKLEETFGKKNVFICLDVFGDDTLLSSMNEVGCIIVVSNNLNLKLFKDKFKSILLLLNIEKEDIGIYSIPKNMQNNPTKISKFIGKKILLNISENEAA